MLYHLPHGAKFEGKGYYGFRLADMKYIEGVDLSSFMFHTVKFCENWNVPFDFVIAKAKELNHLHKMFSFGYEAHGIETTGGIRVAEKALYTLNTDIKGNKVKFYFDVYVRENEYVSTILRKIVPEIVKTYYSWLYIEETRKRFSDDLPDLDPEMSINTYTDNLQFGELSLKDIAYILNNPNWREAETKQFPLYCYEDMVCVYAGETHIDGYTYVHHLQVNIEAIIKRDWSIVENTHVFSVADNRQYHDSWYKGEQKYAPYFEHDNVKKIKKLFEK